MSSGGQVTHLLAEQREGNERARSELMALVYDELHRMAARYMRSERPDHTLQATALVHGAYLQLSKPPDANGQNRAHFLAVAATTMRSTLIDYAAPTAPISAEVANQSFRWRNRWSSPKGDPENSGP